MRNSSVARKPIPQTKIPKPFEANVLGRLRAGAFEEVVAACKRQLTCDPVDALALHYLATALAALDQPKHALAFHAMAIQNAPTNVVFHYQLGQTFMQLRLWDEAAKSYQITMKLAPANTTFALAHAHCLLISSDTACLTALENIVSQHPDLAEAHHLYGSAWRAVGRDAKAAAAYMQAWRLGHKSGETLFNLVKCSDTAQLETLDPLFEEAFLGPRFKSDPLLHFAKAELADRRKQYARAYDSFVEGNAIRARQVNFVPQADAVAADHVIDVFSQTVAQAPAAPRDTPVPIFIVGMPRSGSTLCESILASHSQVTDLGEIGEIVSAVRRLETHDFASQAEALVHIQESYLTSAPVRAAKTPFVVDKYLGNFFYVGHILHAFPNARVLHIHRDPRAVAWSIYRHCFADGQAPFAYRPSDIIDFHTFYRRMMLFWKSKYGDRILDWSYEDMVANPDDAVPVLLDSLGLAWEPECLAHNKAKRMITTASMGQANQPIYAKSSEAWRRYEPYAGDWLSRLPEREWLDNF